MASGNNSILKSIFIYPIKSLGGIALNISSTEERGLPHDRRWLLVDKNNNFLTQRKWAKMALLKVTLTDKGLLVKHSGDALPPLNIPFEIKNTIRITIDIWDEYITAPTIDDPEILTWFAMALGEQVKLVYMDHETSRPVEAAYALNEEKVSFADKFPYLVTNQASLDDLNSKMSAAIPMNRFRPNLVIEGGAPFEEDNWKQLKIGSAVFNVVKPCGRCKVITIDQTTALKNDEPLVTLNTYRRSNNKVIFGQNLLLHKPGMIKAGDKVEITYK